MAGSFAGDGIGLTLASADAGIGFGDSDGRAVSAGTEDGPVVVAAGLDTLAFDTGGVGTLRVSLATSVDVAGVFVDWELEPCTSVLVGVDLEGTAADNDASDTGLSRFAVPVFGRLCDTFSVF